ncbi:O-antigen ligase family protein [Rhizobium glycinendophyticum]|nr:O-antigen ligase family protein [Rhizobium glycinendophyticum]
MTRPLINSISMWAVVVVLTITPFALGGNRPLVWPIVLMVLAAILCLNTAALLLTRSKPAASLSGFKVEVLLGISFLAFAVLQIVPLRMFQLFYVPDLPQSGTISVAPGETLLAIIAWSNVAIISYLALQFTRNEQRAIQFLDILFWVITLHAACGFLLFYEFEDATVIGPKWAYLGSMTGAFVNRNTFATFLASGAVLGVVSLVRDLDQGVGYGRLRAVLLKLPAILLVLAVLNGTGSRMGLFVGLVGIVLVLLLSSFKGRSGRSIKFRVSMLALGAIVALPVLIIGFGGLTLERLGSVDRDADIRTELYQQTWEMISKRSFTGFGGGSYELAFPLIHQQPVSIDLIWQKAHNSYLGLWADYGLIFGSIPWLILLCLLVRLIHVYWTRRTPDYVAITSLSIATIACLHALVDFSLEIQGYSLLFAAIIGTAAGRIASGAERSKSAT